MKKLEEQRKRLSQLADDYQRIADEIGHKLGDSDALFLLKGVVIGMRRCVNELDTLLIDDTDHSNVDTSPGQTSMEEVLRDARDAIKQARGGEAPPQHIGFA
jgi:hypothetical protein